MGWSVGSAERHCLDPLVARAQPGGASRDSRGLGGCRQVWGACLFSSPVMAPPHTQNSHSQTTLLKSWVLKNTDGQTDRWTETEEKLGVPAAPTGPAAMRTGSRAGGPGAAGSVPASPRAVPELQAPRCWGRGPFLPSSPDTGDGGSHQAPEQQESGGPSGSRRARRHQQRAVRLQGRPGGGGGLVLPRAGPEVWGRGLGQLAPSLAEPGCPAGTPSS